MTDGALIASLIDTVIFVLLSLYTLEIFVRPPGIHIFLRNEERRESLYEKFDNSVPKIFQLVLKIVSAITAPLLIIHYIADFLADLSKWIA